MPAGAKISFTFASEKYESIGAIMPLTAYDGTKGASTKTTSISSAFAFPLTSKVAKRSLKGKDSTKWGLIGWVMHDLFGLMVESSMDHELAEELIGKNYLRINSPLGKVNRRLDDNSDSNIERIEAMGESWWELFGDESLKLLSE